MTTLPPLTTHQRKVLDYMLAFFEANDMLPPNSQIARDFGYASPNSEQCTLDQIEAKGYLTRNELGQNIGITVIFTVASILRSYVVRRWFNAALHRAVARVTEGGGV